VPRAGGVQDKEAAMLARDLMTTNLVVVPPDMPVTALA